MKRLAIVVNVAGFAKATTDITCCKLGKKYESELADTAKSFSYKGLFSPLLVDGMLVVLEQCQSL